MQEVSDAHHDDLGSDAPAPKKRKATNGGSRELCGLMHDVKVQKAWDKPVVEGQEELNAHLHHVLKELKGPECTSFAWPFLSKVKKAEAPDYYDLIKQPMDISTMEKKLKKCEYFSKAQFVDDVKLMVSNCRTYNINADSIYRTHAAQLETYAGQLLEKVPEVTLGNQPTGANLFGGNGEEKITDARPIVQRLIHATQVQSEEARWHAATSNLRKNIREEGEREEALEFGDRDALERRSERMGEFLAEPAPKWPEITHPVAGVPSAWGSHRSVNLPTPEPASALNSTKHVSARMPARLALHTGLASLLGAEGFTSVQGGTLPLLADVVSAKMVQALTQLKGKLEDDGTVAPSCVLRALEQAGLPATKAAQEMVGHAWNNSKHSRDKSSKSIVQMKWEDEEIVASGGGSNGLQIKRGSSGR